MARILFVEDDALVRHGLARVLTAAGHEVCACGTVADGISAFAHFELDLLLLDISLPDGDGLQCAKALRDRGFDGPLVFLTARDDAEPLRHAIAQGAHTYLVKPITGAQLVPAIEAALASALGTRERHDRLLAALRDSREISAAVGALAQRDGCSIEDAFELLRRRARSRGHAMTQLAAEVLAELRKDKDATTVIGKPRQMD